MLEFGNKEFRNLQEQVGKNKEDIAALKNGITISYWVAEVTDLPALLKEENVGKYVVVGTTSQKLYLITKRANEGFIADNLGDWPSKGEKGDTGETGPVGPSGRAPKIVVGSGPLPQDNDYEYRDIYIIKVDNGNLHKGDLYQKDNFNNWQLKFNLMGPQGVPADGGDEVIANPEGEVAVDHLSTISIDGIVYDIANTLTVADRAMLTNLETYAEWSVDGSLTLGHDLEADGNIAANNDIEVGRKLVLRGTGTKADIVDADGNPVNFGGSAPANMVTTDTDQIITGTKTIKDKPLIFTSAGDTERGRIEYSTVDSGFDFTATTGNIKIETKKSGGVLELKANSGTGGTGAYVGYKGVYPESDNSHSCGIYNYNWYKVHTHNIGNNDITIPVTNIATKTEVNAKSTVTVSDTGTSTDEVGYITVDGVEKKIAGGGGLPEDPATDGEYYLKDTVASGTGTQSWGTPDWVHVMDAPTSTNLTEDQWKKIIEGVFMNGTFLGIYNPILFPANKTVSGIYDKYIGMIIGQSYENAISRYMITVRTDTQAFVEIAIINTFLKFSPVNGAPIIASSNTQFNGNVFNNKVIPAYPSNTGTFVLKMVNGTLTWVEEV